ncbi:response regulator [Aliiglaciecola sp. CAU 1673]|uniref:response regulator n=1 Tax=Aliiglaciecola sp. CAU 1673 TaxID=3032595 RepID=UPI0023DB4172|nr:response regulator [Aliiglaciecola sp. CAU 1673]MDF2177773.1 response regulator [Aliiglaciecola sp. CAU 1673]
MHDSETKPGRFNALLIEDDGTTTEILSHILRNLGAEQVSAFDTAERATKHLNGVDVSHYDVLICDWHLPGMSGLEFLKLIRLSHPDLPILIITADATLGRVMEAKEAGASDFIAKPFNRNQIDKKILHLVNSTSS